MLVQMKHFQSVHLKQILSRFAETIDQAIRFFDRVKSISDFIESESCDAFCFGELMPSASASALVKVVKPVF